MMAVLPSLAEERGLLARLFSSEPRSQAEKLLELLEKKDPKELTIVINEFSNVLKEYKYSQDEAIYWLMWILEWERIMILKTGKYNCAIRKLWSYN